MRSPSYEINNSLVDFSVLINFNEITLAVSYSKLLLLAMSFILFVWYLLFIVIYVDPSTFIASILICLNES